ncbi:hypothetical protein T440DRAFT_411063 [Plenodomus tracheiphilus IPT5]|uniref:Uncharacterized protein n=1 Tax=Plenodomus tracheiphilus IPT5 TaxID=1408161 RepID=A0A6A7AM02_9PLEO|nr:hypothetical protein T440DRAFT_411063 [Plenodomus tracheiphilus IPT5]
MPVDGHFDLLGVTETNTTLYTLVAFRQLRSSSWIHRISVGTRSTHRKHTPRVEAANSLGEGQTDRYKQTHILFRGISTVKVKSWRFPLGLRCEHVEGNNGAGEGVKSCRHECYLLEKGGKMNTTICKSENCEGHAWSGNIVADDNGITCFGKHRKRKVLLVQGKRRDDEGVDTADYG